MALPSFDVREPSTVDEALNILAQGGPGTAALAGGTDLVVAMKKGLKAPSLVVSLNKIPGLDCIEEREESIVIGPLVTMTTLCRSVIVRDRLPVLADGAGVVAAPLIRNRATVGGNLCNARPCADTAPPLMALGATVVLAGAGGKREIALDSMITGPGETVLEQGEILTAIKVPLPAENSGGCYIKMTRRQTLDVTITGVASQVVLDAPGGPVTKVRIFATSVAPVPLRLAAAEACVLGKKLDDEALRAAAEAASKEVKPIDDLRGEAWYRRHVTGVLVRRTLAAAVRRASRSGGGAAGGGPASRDSGPASGAEGRESGEGRP
jgi:carbon-monoxide dehydrogenase medium subunit